MYMSISPTGLRGPMGVFSLPSDWTKPVKGACFNVSDRPLLDNVTPAQFSNEELLLDYYDLDSPSLTLEDGEPDDFLAILIGSLEKQAQLIAESHGKREEVYERTLDLLKQIPRSRGFTTELLKGDATSETMKYLIRSLGYLDDHSLTISVLAPSPTLAALIDEVPNLLASKIKKIVSLGGFAHRDCETGELKGTKVYYTTHNLSANLDAGQKMFTFAEQHKVPLYIISTDNLRLPRTINTDIVEKLESMDTDATHNILKECKAWNAVSSKGKTEKESMTPADPIAKVFALAFDSLEIKSRGISSIKITKEPRYEEGKPAKHRAVSLQFDDQSTIRYVDGFSLRDSGFNTTKTFQVLLNHLLNKFWKKHIGEHHMSIPPIGLKPYGIKIFEQDEQKGTDSQMDIARSSSSSSSSGQIQLPPSAPVALPKGPASFEELIASDPITEEAMKGKYIAPTADEINSLANRNDFFGLKNAMQDFIVSEYQNGKYSIVLRDMFRVAFTKVQNNLKGELKQLEEQIKKMEPSPKKDELQELVFFISEGRGAETVRIYSKILLPLHPLDSDYRDKIMKYAQNQWHFRPKDLIPGTGKTLLQLTVDNKAKHNIPIKDSLRINDRTDRILEATESMYREVEKLSAYLSESEFMNRFVGKGVPCDLFVRGAMGVGKTTFINYFLGLKEKDIFSSDALKNHPAFGKTPLAHHESTAAKDDLDAWAAKNVKRRVHGQSNVRNRDNEIISNIAKGKACVICDLTADAKTIAARVAKRAEGGGRVQNEKEFNDSINDAVNNRPALIAEALKNKNITYVLYDTSDVKPQVILESRMGKVEVHNREILGDMCASNDKLGAVLSSFISSSMDYDQQLA